MERYQDRTTNPSSPTPENGRHRRLDPVRNSLQKVNALLERQELLGDHNGLAQIDVRFGMNRDVNRRID